MNLSEKVIRQAKKFYSIVQGCDSLPKSQDKRGIKGRGRKLDHIIAGCIYIVIRQNKIPKLLMDFSKLLHINIYTLGSCYLKIIEKLNFHESRPDIPLLDPQIYIHKFCSQLNFGPHEHKINQTANKFLACLKRD